MFKHVKVNSEKLASHSLFMVHRFWRCADFMTWMMLQRQWAGYELFSTIVVSNTCTKRHLLLMITEGHVSTSGWRELWSEIFKYRNSTVSTSQVIGLLAFQKVLISLHSLGLQIVGIHHWKHGRKGAGIAWLQRAKDDKRLAAVADELLNAVSLGMNDSQTESLEVILDSGTSRNSPLNLCSKLWPAFYPLTVSWSTKSWWAFAAFGRSSGLAGLRTSLHSRPFLFT